MPTSRAHVAVDDPTRYAKQLVSHLGRRVEFRTETTAAGSTSTADLGGGTARIVVGDGVLTLLAEGPDESAVERIEHVLGSHLERFGQRSQLVVAWSRSGTPPPAAQSG